MNGKTQILAVAAVVVMVAAAFVGIGYAYQAQFTDYGTQNSTLTGKFITVQDSTGTNANAISLDGGVGDLTLHMGTNITKTASGYNRYWDATNYEVLQETNPKTKVTTKVTVTEVEESDVQTKIEIRALYCLGSYDIKAAEAVTAKVDLDQAVTTDLTVTNVGEGNTYANKIVLSTASDLSYTSGNLPQSEVKSLNLNLTADTATTVYVYVYALATIFLPSADNPTVTLSLVPTAPPVVVATVANQQ